MLFLASTPDIAPITDLINTWIQIGQALVGSVGALAFIFALARSGIKLLLVGMGLAQNESSCKLRRDKGLPRI